MATALSNPPGTVLLEDLHQRGRVVLQPQPSSDPNDPLNWPAWRKYLNFVLVSLYVLLVYSVIDVVTVTWSEMNLELGFSYDILNDSYAAGFGALCLGSVLLLPFALKYGRRPVYVFSLALQMGICIWSARQQTVADLMLVNILCCLVGALAEVILQMTVADVFFVHQRGRLNSFYVGTYAVGASLSPTAAGYVATSQGWRWVWWWLAILLGAALVTFVFLYEETKYEGKYLAGIPISDESAGETMDTETAGGPGSKTFDQQTPKASTVDAEPQSRADVQDPLRSVAVDSNIPLKSYHSRLALFSPSASSLASFIRHMYQPFVLLFTFPAVFYMSLLNAAQVSAGIIPITVYSTYMTFPPYNFNPHQIGLLGIPAVLGTLLSAVISGPLSDWMILRLAKRHNGVYEPEMRLWLILVFHPFWAAGNLMFGIGLDRGMSWPFVCVGLGLASFGSTPAISLSLTYLTDTYTELVCDCLVAVTFAKNLLPMILVFVLTSWINNMGIANVFILITAVFTAIVLGNIVFLFYGKRFRARTAESYRQFSQHSLGTCMRRD